MRFFSVLALVAGTLIATPVLAQSTNAATERTRDLATAYVEILDLDQLVVETYETMNEALPDWERLQREMMGPVKGDAGVAPMPSFVQELEMEVLRPFIDIGERLLIETYARAYTEDQLEAMTRFASTRMGREILRRRDEFIATLITVVIEQMPTIREELGLGVETEDYELGTPSDQTPTREMRPVAPLPFGLRPDEVPLVIERDAEPSVLVVPVLPE
jgi:hypothetical protein